MDKKEQNSRIDQMVDEPVTSNTLAPNIFNKTFSWRYCRYQSTAHSDPKLQVYYTTSQPKPIRYQAWA